MVKSYFFRARFLPTILTCIPLLVLFNSLVAPYYHESLKPILKILPTVLDLGFSTGLIFLSVQLNRIVSKEIFQKLYFKEEIKMPTTNYLLWSNNFFDNSIKTILHQKINDKFGISLLLANEEQSNQDRARNVIVTATSQIRNSLRDNSLLLQHNIEYGFFRNLIGGSLLASVISIIIIIISWVNHYQSLLMTGILLTIIYLIPVLLSKYIINRFGKYYAKVLLEQFLSV